MEGNMRKRIFTSVWLVFLVLFFTPIPTLSTENTAPTFTTSNGKVHTDITINQDTPYDIAIQSDNKIVVGGSANGYLALIRYTENGELDSSFGNHGIVIADFDTPYYQEFRSIALQEDGKIVTAGAGGSIFGSATIVRYNSTGTLDTSFDSDGISVTYSLSQARGIAIQSDGKILVSGSKNQVFATTRFNIDGSIDLDFGVDGIALTDISDGADYGYGIAIQTDEKIIVGGTGDNDFALARYNIDGSLDTTFGTGGIVNNDFHCEYISPFDYYFIDSTYGFTVLIQPDERIILVGSCGGSEAIARYHPDGSLDTTFGINGFTLMPSSWYSFASDDYDRFFNAVLQEDGKIVVSAQYNYEHRVSRFNSDGSLDNSFDFNGKIESLQGEYGSAVAHHVNTTILNAGTTNYWEKFTLWRHKSDGSLDYTFGPLANTVAKPITIREDGGSILSSEARVYDAELSNIDNYSGSTLILSRTINSNSDDVFYADDYGSLTQLIEGSYFAVEGISIGRVIKNSDGILQLAFNYNSTDNLISKSLQFIAYKNTSDNPPPSVQIDWTFSDGNTGAQGTGGELCVTSSTPVNITPVNDAPIMVNALPDMMATADYPFIFTIPDDTFRDPDGDLLTLTLTMQDGTGLPPWLSFDPNTRTMSGTPATDETGVFNIVVHAIDPSNYRAIDYITLTVEIDDPDADGIPNEWDSDPYTQAPNICSGSNVYLSLPYPINAGTQISCRADESITTGSLDIELDGTLALMAPIINIGTDFHAQLGSKVKMTPQNPSVTTQAKASNSDPLDNILLRELVITTPAHQISTVRLPSALLKYLDARDVYPEAIYDTLQSADESIIVFTTDQPLLPQDSNLHDDIYLFDITIEQLRLISQGYDGAAGNGHSNYPNIDGLANHIVFQSRATNLTIDDSNGASNIFVYDREYRYIEKISDNESGHPSIDSLGETIIFDHVNDSGLRDIRIFDWINKTTNPIIVDIENDQHHPAISANGRYISFLNSSDVSGCSVHFVDRESGTESIFHCPDSLTENAETVRPFFNADSSNLEWIIPEIDQPVIIDNPLLQ
jgi:uncharacterized delta-60 repeat protein